MSIFIYTNSLTNKFEKETKLNLNKTGLETCLKTAVKNWFARPLVLQGSWMTFIGDGLNMSACKQQKKNDSHVDNNSNIGDVNVNAV